MFGWGLIIVGVCSVTAATAGTLTVVSPEEALSASSQQCVTTQQQDAVSVQQPAASPATGKPVSGTTQQASSTQQGKSHQQETAVKPTADTVRNGSVRVETVSSNASLVQPAVADTTAGHATADRGTAARAQRPETAQVADRERVLDPTAASASSIAEAESEIVLSTARQDTSKKTQTNLGISTMETEAPITVQEDGITFRSLRDTLTQSPGIATVTLPDTLSADTVVKKGFFHKFYNYFKSANVDKTLTKKFDFSVIGGPHYSSDVKLGLGIVAAGLYRVDRKDLTIPPSNVSLFGDITTTGFWMLGIRGNTLFNSGKLRLDYTTYFFSFPSAYWGVGYDNGMYATAGSYKRLQSQVKINLLFQLKPKFYLGPGFNFNYTRGENFSNIEMLNGENQQYISTGVGVILMYDSRDIIYNASRGIYARFEQFVYPTFFGNSRVFTQTELTFDAYHKLWKGATMAYDLYAQFSGGQTPWTMLPRLGGSMRMRGYYEGRYRDRQMVEVQAELRQHIYNRHGVAVWVGAGNVFPNFNKFNPAHTLPNWGIGYRWEFKNKVNVRLDYGFGKGESSFLFSINEAF